MCGIAGVHCSAGRVRDRFARALTLMSAALAHRGPDGAGEFFSSCGRVALAHRRLAILDIGDSGAQPMVGTQGHSLVFNGEVYNHAELRGDACLGSTGDAATLLHLLARDGERALPKLNGMFAFACNSPDGSVLLARDTFGQKPLYYAQKDGVFAFASETRALVAGGFAGETPDPVALGSLAQKGSVPGEHTHLAEVRALPPGSWLRVKADGKLDGPHDFGAIDWKPCVGRFDEAAETLGPLLQKAAQRTLLSDVPLCAFLSGGIDSTVVCALLLAAGARDLRTFCVSVPGTVFDEAGFASRAAAFLGTKHTSIVLSEREGRALVAEAEQRRDVPGIDGANTYIVAKAVRDAGFKVALSGLGGDELFGGYPSFADARKWAGLALRLGKVPGARLLTRLGGLGGKLSRIARAAKGGLDAASLYCARRSLSPAYLAKRALPWVPSARAHVSEYDYPADVRARAQGEIVDAGNRALNFEQRIYLHDQLLRDNDQMGMAVGLEIRAPLLDAELALACAGISGDLKAERGPKGLLIAAAERATGLKFPREIVTRRKQGFMLPLEKWSG